MTYAQKAGKWLFEKATGIRAWRSSDPWPTQYGSILGLDSASSSGIVVTGPSSLQLSAVYGCTSLLARVHGSFPVRIVQKIGNTRKILDDHYLAPLFKDAPNPLMSWMDFSEQQSLSFDLTGNAYAEIVRIGKRITALWPLHPERVKVILKGGELSYEYTKESGQIETYAKEDILHVRNFSMDGVNGLSPIAAQREVLGRALAEQNYGSSVFRNGGRPSGVLSHPASLAPEKAQKLRESWEQIYGGSQNAGRTAVLWEGMKYEAISLSLADAQYIDSRKMSVAEIASTWGVPLNLLAQSDKSATYASAEQFDLQFVKYTISPRCVRFEQAFKRALFANEPGVYAKFNLGSLLRGDAASRASYYSTMVQNGLMKRNEARSFEDLDPVDGADDLTVQSNMIDLSALQKLVAQSTTTPATGGNTNVPAT